MNQQPFWTSLPFINNRTAWKPISFPVILVIPFGATQNSDKLQNAIPLSITVKILDVVRRNRVAGHQHINEYYPNTELYTQTINQSQLTKLILDPTDFHNDGTNITVTNHNGQTGPISYNKDYIYFDLSKVAIPVENLQQGRYLLSYQATINKRVYDSNGTLVCIDDTSTELIIKNIEINHPGEIISEFVKTSPQMWFSNSPIAEEKIITLYRPLSDALQNVYDEQSLLSKINFINDVYPETIPLLSQLIGWDIPYFPRSLDKLRVAALKTGTYFQKNRSSYSCIKQLFDLFGYNIYIQNLWNVGGKLIEPTYDQNNVVYKNDQLILDIAIAGLTSPGFYTAVVPLTKHPSTKTEFENYSDIYNDYTIEAYAVTKNGAADVALKEFITNNDLSNNIDVNGTIINADLETALANVEIYANHQVRLTNNSTTTILSTGPRNILSLNGCKTSKYKPEITIELDGHWNDPSLSIYVFVLYRSQVTTITDEAVDHRSNYFDLRLESKENVLTPTNLVLDYALEFLYRIKALHSLLRQIILNSDSTDVYLVSDYCYGEGLSIDGNTQSGQQQVPPAILLLETAACQDQNPIDLGYKKSDIKYRSSLLTALLAEWESYLIYDNRLPSSNNKLGMLTQYPDNSRDKAKYNQYNQDAYTGTYEQSSTNGLLLPFNLANQNTGKDVQREYELLSDEPYEPITDLNARTPICFKGRVSNDLAINRSIVTNDTVVPSTCMTMGNSALFTTRKVSQIEINGSSQRRIGSNSKQPYTTSNEPSGTVFTGSKFKSDVGVNPIRLSGSVNDVLHQYDGSKNLDVTWDSACVDVPNLNIKIPSVTFPGCRPLSMDNYNGTYVTNYEKRPWDFSNCEKPVYTKIIKEDGNEYLEYDLGYWGFEGNGVEPDVPSIGSAILSNNHSADDIVHAIYSKNARQDENGLTPYNDSDIIEIETPLFDSAVKCGENYLDFKDGYPSVVGLITKTFSIHSDGTGPSEITLQRYYTTSSVIRDGSKGHRLSCDCVQVSCDNEVVEQCQYKEVDELEVESFMSFNDEIGCELLVMDGSISMF